MTRFPEEMKNKDQAISPTVILLLILSFTQCQGSIKIPGLVAKTSEVVLGDIMIGGLISMHNIDRVTRQPCVRLIEPAMEWVQALHYGLKMVNSDPNLLPNITLGIQILDTCFLESVAIAQAMQFIPTKYLVVAGVNKTNERDVRQIHGVVGDMSTPLTNAAHKILLQFQIPQVSPTATNPYPGADTNHPYLFKLLSPERFKARAIVDFIAYHNWTYVSLISGDDSASFEVMKYIMAWTREANICLAYSKTLATGASDEEMTEIANALYVNKKARVIIMAFSSVTLGRYLVRALERLVNVKDYFTYIFDGPLVYGTPNTQNSANIRYSFGISKPQKAARDFHNAFVLQTFETVMESPWGPEYMKDLTGCLWDSEISSNSTGTACQDLMNQTLKSAGKALPQGPTSAVVTDSFLTVAHGLHNLIADNCPEASVDKSVLESCISGPLLKAYLHNLSFTGISGNVAFDKYGDGMGGYLILQYQDTWPYLPRTVAKFDRQADTLVVYESQLKYKHNFETACSKECKLGERKIVLEVKCCWECIPCRNNEIIVKNGTNCVVCPEMKWPDKKTLKTCLRIRPTMLEWSEPLGICLVAAVPLFVIVSLVHYVIYFVNRHSRVIKASSYPLSMIMLSGNLLGFLTVFTTVARPTNLTCYIQRLCFNLSYSIVYGPLLVKSSQIYYIFASGKHGQARPAFVSSKWQLIFSLMTIGMQVVILLCTAVTMSPRAVLNMPVRTERYVELLCDLPLPALLIPLSYNILLVLISAVYGFKTRHLPDNFNETKYIFLSVCATLFLWIAFLPTYVVANNAKNKTAILALSLLINGTVILLCLFLPRVYALFYVDENRFSTASTIKNRVGVNTVTVSSTRTQDTKDTQA